MTAYITPATKLNFNTALPKFINAWIPKILFKPEMGLNLLAFGAIAIQAKFNPPIEEPANRAATISNRNKGMNNESA